MSQQKIVVMGVPNEDANTDFTGSDNSQHAESVEVDVEEANVSEQIVKAPLQPVFPLKLIYLDGNL